MTVRDTRCPGSGSRAVAERAIDGLSAACRRHPNVRYADEPMRPRRVATVLVKGIRVDHEVAAILGRAMSAASAPDELAMYSSDPSRALLGWSDGDILVSVAGLFHQGTDAELLHIATRPGHERRGYAAALVGALMQHLSLTSLTAETDDEEVAFYRASKFDVAPVSSPWPTPRYRCVRRSE